MATVYVLQSSSGSLRQVVTDLDDFCLRTGYTQEEGDLYITLNPPAFTPKRNAQGRLMAQAAQLTFYATCITLDRYAQMKYKKREVA